MITGNDDQIRCGEIRFGQHRVEHRQHSVHIRRTTSEPAAHRARVSGNDGAAHPKIADTS